MTEIEKDWKQLDHYKPRFSFEISMEQKERADRLFGTYGTRKAIFNTLLDEVLDLIEEHGGVAIGILMSGKVKPRDIIPSMQEVEEVVR